MLSIEDLQRLDPARIPHHIAIIPDGNRRWAREQELSVQKGHREGADILMDTLRAAKAIGVRVVTFYTFSTENWSRPSEEVEGLMWLIETYLENELPNMVVEGIRFDTIGDLDLLPDSLRRRIELTKEMTAEQGKIDLILALNYGSRNEIVRTCRKLAAKVASGMIKEEDITEAMITQNLDTFRWKDPDLLIRTSGENRLSNFLLWQLSYGEMYLTPVLWPDFTPRHLLDAVFDFQKRERRLGGSR